MLTLAGLAVLLSGAPVLAQDSEAGSGGPPPVAEGDTDISSFDWPTNYALDDMRGLPACEVKPRPGENWSCRPPPPPRGWPTSFGLSIGPGILSLESADTTHNAFAVGMRFEAWLAPWLALGVRGQTLSTGLRNRDDDEDSGHAGLLLGTARLRWFTDEVDRDAFTLSAGFGQAFYGDDLGAGGEPVLRLSIGRDIGTFVSPTGAITGALNFEYLAGLGDNQLRAFMATVELGGESNIAEPDNVITRDEPPAIEYAIGWYAGLFGAGASLGHYVTRRTKIYARADWTAGLAIGGAGGDTALYYTGLVGVHQRTSLLYGILFVDAAVGYSWLFSDQGVGQAPVADIEVGISANAECGTRGGVGIRPRLAYADGVKVATIMVMGSIEWGSSPRAIGITGGPRMCGGDFSGRVVDRDMSGFSVRPGGNTRTDVSLRHVKPGQIDLDALEPKVEVKVEAPGVTPEGAGIEITTPTVEVKPVEVEVVLGYVLLGGNIEIAIDAGSLPLVELRRATNFEIRILGPASALPRAQQQLRLQLDRQGITGGQIDTQVAEGKEIRAVFTIQPLR